LQRLIFYVEI